MLGGVEDRKVLAALALSALTGIATPACGQTVQSVTQYSYDANERLECTAVRMNPTVFGSLPSSACTLGTTGSNGADRITRNTYDAAGQLLKVQKAYAITTANGFPVTLQQDYATYTYTTHGKIDTMTDANGNKASMTYDGFDRQTRWNFPSKTIPGAVSTTDFEAYEFDANGNRTKLTKRDTCPISYTYDALNRMVIKDLPSGVVGGVNCGSAPDVYYGYDLRGLQTFARFLSATGVGITNNYDGFGRLKDTTNDMSGPTTTKMLSYEWDVDGNRTKITHPDSTTADPRYFTYEYDGLGRNVTIKENGASTIVTETYDNQGRRATETRGGVTTTYTYDPVSRLKVLFDDLTNTINDVSSTFAYNPANQVTSKSRSNDLYAFNAYPLSPVSRSYTTNGLNQYATAGTATFTYDANGNLTGDGTNTFTYDVENRMLTASGPVATTLQYDPMGRLWKLVTAPKTIEWTYDGDAMVTETSGTGMHRFIHGNGEDDPLIWYSGSTLANRRSLQADAQGSIVSTADSSGASLGINTYDEYGVPGAGVLGRFLYTGQMYLGQLGMYYYKARIYSPTLGRFMQTDPIGYADQNNLYAYVGNDPVNLHDASGTSKCCDEEIDPEGEAEEAGRSAREAAERGDPLQAPGVWRPAAGSPAASTTVISSPNNPPTAGEIQAAQADAAGFDLAPNQPGYGLQNNGGFSPRYEGPSNSFLRPLLRMQLASEAGASWFNADGTLTYDAVESSVMIQPNSKMENSSVPNGYDKYSLRIDTPSGRGDVHFYREPVSGDVYYGLDYKVKF